MSEKRILVLSHSEARRRAVQAVAEAPEGFVVRIEPPTRTSEQNAKFHAICSDMARAGFEWGGKRRSAEQIKVLLVSGHAQATKEGSEIIPGLEGEFVSIRESTALMSKKRGASLIEYALALCSMKRIPLRDGVEA